jgi:hypothetical protein
MRNSGALPPGITIFSGRFGSGKTEVAINYALSLTRGSAPDVQEPAARAGHVADTGHQGQDGIILIDLDIVTPYFRSRETADRMRTQGVTVVAPSVIGQHLDTPAITPQIMGAIQQPARRVVLDVGGDQQGARALGQFSAAIEQRGYTMHFVVNPYRPFTDTLEGLATSIAEIEAGSRLQVSSLVSNPNLIAETTMERIVQGHAQIEGFAQELGLPIALVCVERRWASSLDANHFSQPVLYLDRYFVMSWD